MATYDLHMGITECPMPVGKHPADPCSKFLCRAYTEAIRAGSNSYAPRRTYAGEKRSAPMLTMALLVGFAFVCLVIVHDRLTNRL